MPSKTDFANGTSITRSYPWGLNVAAMVQCPDGIVRKCKRIAACADTFFSTPASVTVRGRTVAGFITLETRSGMSTATPDDPAVLRFFPYKYRKHGAIFDRATNSAHSAREV